MDTAERPTQPEIKVGPDETSLERAQPQAPPTTSQPPSTQPTVPPQSLQNEPPSGKPPLDPTRGIPTAITTAALGKLTADKMESQGHLEVEPGRTLTPEEQRIADLLVAEGCHVIAKAENTAHGVKNPDFEVDGILTELKTISSLTGKNMGGSLGRRILDAKSQATHAIIDVRDQAGMILEVAENAAKRAYVAQTISGKVRLQEVRIIGKDFDVTIPYDPSR